MEESIIDFVRPKFFLTDRPVSE